MVPLTPQRQEYSISSILCSLIVCLMQFNALFVWSQPRACKNMLIFTDYRFLQLYNFPKFALHFSTREYKNIPDLHSILRIFYPSLPIRGWERLCSILGTYLQLVGAWLHSYSTWFDCVPCDFNKICLAATQPDQFISFVYKSVQKHGHCTDHCNNWNSSHKYTQVLDFSVPVWLH